MAATACTPPVTICPPHEAWKGESFDRYQFSGYKIGKVSRTRTETGGTHVNDNELSFDDAARLHYEVHTIGRRRRLETPAWGTSDREMRRLLVFFYQKRCNIRKVRITDDKKEQRKILGECQELEAKVILPQLLATLDKHCRAYVICQDPTAKSAMQSVIEGEDTRIKSVRAGCGLVLRVVAGIYRRGLNATQIGDECHLKPVTIRQLLHRLSVNYAQLTGKPFVPQRWARSESERTPKASPRVARQQNIQKAIHAVRVNGARRRLAKAEAALAVLRAIGKGRFVADAVAKAAARFVPLEVDAHADVEKARARVLALAKEVL